MHMYTRDDPDEGLACEALVAMTTRVQSSARRVERRDMKEGERERETETAAHWQLKEESPCSGSIRQPGNGSRKVEQKREGGKDGG